MNIFMQRFLFLTLCTTSLLACSKDDESNAKQSNKHSCEFASGAEIANAMKQAGAEVQESVTYESRDKVTTTACQWTFNNSNGQKVFVDFRKTERTEKIKNPIYFSQRIERLGSHGQEIGGKTIAYTVKDLEAIQGGALSQIYGNRFTKTLTYQWHDNEQRMKMLTLSKNINNEGQLIEPVESELNNLIDLLFR